MDDVNKSADSEINSLEDPATVVESGDKPAVSTQTPAPTPVEQPTPPPPRTSLPSHWQRLLHGFNIYLLLFILLLIFAGATGAVFYLKDRTTSSTTGLSSQPLSQSALSQLATNDVSVGEPQHTLNVQSNAVFTGSVLVRSSLQIAGALQVGSGTAVDGLRVTGNSTFDTVQVTQSLAVTGNGSVQGQLSIQKSLQVSGDGTFSGNVSASQLTVSSLQLNGTLSLTHHIAAGGSTPSITSGSALGGGGTVSVSGSDTAGSLTINTGSSPGPGCFATLTFKTAFNSTPHVVITPIGSSAAGLSYYSNRSTTSLSICTTSSPPATATFGFDYIVFD